MTKRHIDSLEEEVTSHVAAVEVTAPASSSKLAQVHWETQTEPSAENGAPVYNVRLA